MTLVFANTSSVPPTNEATRALSTELANSTLRIINGTLFTSKSKEQRTFYSIVLAHPKCAMKFKEGFKG